MKASVIICTYNRAECLRTALQLLEWQTYDDFEVIVVNGPSTDHTEEVLAEYEGKIKIFHNLYENLPISRNIGANAASGDILCFIDDDSEPDTPWLAAVMHEFEDERVGGVTGPVYGSTESDLSYSAWVSDSKVNIRSVAKLYPHYSSLHCDTFSLAQGCNMSIRRVALEQIGGFLEDLAFYHEEPELHKRIIKQNYSVVNVASCALVHHTATGDNDKTMRTKSKGLLRPFHFLKNMIYLRFLWRELDEPIETTKLAAESMATNLFNDGKRRFEEGILSYEEWCHYKAGIVPAVKWGIEHGIAKDLKAPAIAPVKCEAFLPFSRRRKNNALVICLLLWSLEHQESGVVQDYSLLAKNFALRGHEVHVLAPTYDDGFCNFADYVHWHHVHVDNYIILANAQSTSNIINCCGILYNAVRKISKQRVVDVCLGYIFCSTPLFFGLDISYNSILALCTTHKTLCKAHQHWKSIDNELVAEIEALTVRKHKNIHTISEFIVHGVMQDYPDSIHEDAIVFNVPLGTQRKYNAICASSSKTVRILFVSRLEGRKCPDVLLAAFTKVASKHNNVELVMAGNDTLLAPTGRTYRQDFEAQYMGTDIGNRVHFTGFISEEEKWAQYHACDIFCMPSFSESFGITFIEAMSCGKPVIGCRAGGMPEVIAEGETGLLAEPGDVDSLVVCLERLIEDAALRERMGTAARRRYEQNFTSEIYAERMEKEFYRITGKVIGI